MEAIQWLSVRTAVLISSSTPSIFRSKNSIHGAFEVSSEPANSLLVRRTHEAVRGLVSLSVDVFPLRCDGPDGRNQSCHRLLHDQSENHASLDCPREGLFPEIRY